MIISINQSPLKHHMLLKNSLTRLNLLEPVIKHQSRNLLRYLHKHISWQLKNTLCFDNLGHDRVGKLSVLLRFLLGAYSFGYQLSFQTQFVQGVVLILLVNEAHFITVSIRNELA